MKCSGWHKTLNSKTERMAHKTGNVYVEFQSRGKDSGIRSSKSDTWIFKIGVSTGA